VTTTLGSGRLPNGSLVDIRIESGAIAAIEPAAGHPVDVDLGRWLVLPALGEPHAHLDKALTADVVANPEGDLAGAIAAWSAAAPEFGHDDILLRASQALDRLVVSGATAVRTHVNCSGTFGRRAMEAMLEVRRRYAAVVDLQLVALPSRPLLGPDGSDNRRSLEAAIAAGFDVVGGAPHLDPDGHAATRYCLEIALEAGLPLDLHTDETLDPAVSNLAYLARLVLDGGFPYRVTASHCVSHGMQREDRQSEVAAAVAAAGIGVVTLPHTNLFLQARGTRVAPPRGLAGIAALRAAGVVVAAGADNLQDPFQVVGRGDPLETAALMVMAGHLSAADALRAVSGDVRLVLGLEPVEVAVGFPADLVVVDATTTRAAIADAPGSRMVFHRGRLVAESRRSVSVRL
jgi:cytosine deaminase